MIFAKEILFPTNFHHIHPPTLLHIHTYIQNYIPQKYQERAEQARVGNEKVDWLTSKILFCWLGASASGFFICGRLEIVGQTIGITFALGEIIELTLIAQQEKKLNHQLDTRTNVTWQRTQSECPCCPLEYTIWPIYYLSRSPKT